MTQRPIRDSAPIARPSSVIPASLPPPIFLCTSGIAWAGADRLKDDLLALNVVVNDKERSWALRAGASGSGGGGGGGGGGGVGGGGGGYGGGGGGGGYGGSGGGGGGGGGGGPTGGQFRGPLPSLSGPAATTRSHDYTRSASDQHPVRSPEPIHSHSCHGLIDCSPLTHPLPVSFTGGRGAREHAHHGAHEREDHARLRPCRLAAHGAPRPR